MRSVYGAVDRGFGSADKEMAKELVVDIKLRALSTLEPETPVYRPRSDCIFLQILLL